MNTRFAPAPAFSGISALREAGLKVSAYFSMLSEVFTEAKAQARAAQARRPFIQE